MFQTSVIYAPDKNNHIISRETQNKKWNKQTNKKTEATTITISDTYLCIDMYMDAVESLSARIQLIHVVDDHS